jgi:hypothetical protein
LPEVDQPGAAASTAVVAFVTEAIVVVSEPPPERTILAFVSVAALKLAVADVIVVVPFVTTSVTVLRNVEIANST